jgi:Ser/Thr protein kinase RdoA (MazF antagonist)
MTPGLVRVGNTVRRPLHDRSPYVQAVLMHLEAVGFDGAPRFLGVDDRGREILTHLEGEVPDGAPALMSDARLRTTARLVREFHDATAGTALAGTGEVVCHGDLGHHNTGFRGERAIGLIDWDDGVGPGSRLVDFAHAVWCLAGVGERSLPISYQAHAVEVMCEVYEWADPRLLVDEIADRLRRARDEHARHGHSRAVAEFEQMIASMKTVEPELRKRLA